MGNELSDALSGSALDPVEEKVLRALADTRWDLRSAAGVAHSEKLPVDQVKAILAKHDGNLVRKSKIRTTNGDELFTLASRGQSVGEIWDLARFFASKAIR